MVKTIFYLLLFYFVFKLLGRVLMPIINRGKGNKSQNNPRGAQPNNRDEGEVRIEFTKSEEAKRKDGNREGEYVEFEELD